MTIQNEKQRAGASGWTPERRRKQAERIRARNQSRTQSRLPEQTPRAEPFRVNYKAIQGHSKPYRVKSIEKTIDTVFSPRIRYKIYRSELEYQMRKKELVSVVKSQKI